MGPAHNAWMAWSEGWRGVGLDPSRSGRLAAGETGAGIVVRDAGGWGARGGGVGGDWGVGSGGVGDVTLGVIHEAAIRSEAGSFPGGQDDGCEARDGVCRPRRDTERGQPRRDAPTTAAVWRESRSGSNSAAFEAGGASCRLVALLPARSSALRAARDSEIGGLHIRLVTGPAVEFPGLCRSPFLLVSAHTKR